MPRIAWIGLLVYSATALAWGPEGHSLIARIAEVQLTPAARDHIAAILGPGQTMASVASWADEVRRSRPESAPWHFIDIPNSQAHLDMARDCPKGACVIAKIEELRRTLRDPATPPAQQKEALMFLVHFVGDMHQPLHCSDQGDRGGNGVRVVFHDRTTNLHSVWDSAMLGRLAPADDLFPTLSAESLRRKKKWSKGTVEQWAEESHRAAHKIIYGKLPKAAGTAPIPLDAPYESVGDRLIREQLEKAGARLAEVLNETFR
ncbi:MAG TPA: S1/P1 nuclease [Bryobacteraceae bacterium]|nr:S1/P1 nuclease [Bryobacteraceae bacterium]